MVGKWLRSIACVALIMLFAGTLAYEGAQEEAAAKASQAARERWGDSVIEVKQIPSQRVAAWFKEQAAYHVHVKNRTRSGPDSYTYAMIVGPDRPIYITGEDAAAEFLTLQKRAVGDVEEALEAVLVFCDLLRWEPQLKQRPGKNLEWKTPAKADDWKMEISESENGWIIRCILLVDPVPEVNLCQQYRFDIGRRGMIQAQRGNTVFYVGLYL